MVADCHILNAMSNINVYVCTRNPRFESDCKLIDTGEVYRPAPAYDLGVVMVDATLRVGNRHTMLGKASLLIFSTRNHMRADVIIDYGLKIIEHRDIDCYGLNGTSKHLKDYVRGHFVAL